MKTSITRAVFAVLAAMLLTATVSALPSGEPQSQEEQRVRRAERHDRSAMRQRGPQARLARALDLTEDQQDAWKQEHEAHRDAVRPLMEEMRTLQRQLDAELEDDAADAMTLGDLLLQIKDVRQQIAAENEALQSALEAILDAEQLERWQELKDNGRGRARARGPRARRGGAGIGSFGPPVG